MTTKKTTFLRAFEASAGVVSEACRKARVGRSTYYDWLEEDPKFKSQIDEIRDEQLDLAESTLKNLAFGLYTRSKNRAIYKKEPDGKALMFLLSTIGKARGYTQKQEIETTEKLDLTKLNSEEKTQYLKLCQKLLKAQK